MSEPTSARDRIYWMYFTRIAKHVSVGAMREMVSNSLQSQDPPDVVKLVPRWSSNENLHYISYKVGVKWKYKEKAIHESTWPAGLLFRKFIQRDPGYWEP